MPPTCPIATCTPTPVRNPTSTVRDRKLARKPSRATRATKRNPPASRALNPAYATHSEVLGWSPEMPRPAIPGEHDRRGRRIPADDEMPRRPEEGVRCDRDQDRVEAGDHRRAGDLRVAHHLRDRERGERDAGDDVLRQPRALVRDDPVEDGHITAQAARSGDAGDGTHRTAGNQPRGVVSSWQQDKEARLWLSKRPGGRPRGASEPVHPMRVMLPAGSGGRLGGVVGNDLRPGEVMHAWASASI